MTVFLSKRHWPLRYTTYFTPALTLLLAGCMTTPNYKTPSVGDAAAASEARSAVLKNHSALTEAAIPSKWWTLFNDKTLSALEKEIDNNLDLRAATIRIEESRDQLGLTNASRMPAISAQSSYTRSALSENSPLHKLGAPTHPTNAWTLGLQASWELDLWGHLRYLTESAQANVKATQYQEEAVRVSVSAEIARTYLLLRGIQAQIIITQDNQEIASHLVQLAESRVSQGVASRYDVAAASADQATIQAQLFQLQHQRDVLMNALALLLGQQPRELNAQLASSPLPSMPATLPIGLSSELARNRPDILEAQEKLHAAVANIGAAKADFYPRIGLGGAIGLQGYNASELGNWASRQFSVGPTIYLPIFEGGRLESNLALNESRQQLAAISYQKTVLSAWHEVDNALDDYSTELARHQQLEIAENQSQAALTVATNAYKEGSGDFTSVLLARRSLLASQSALANSATASALSVVGLYRALGGGWSPDLLSTDKTSHGQTS